MFVAVARSGSYKRAVQETGLTSTTIGRRIARLEQLMGVRLFDRESGTPRMTYEGLSAFNEAMAAEAIVARVVRRADAAARRIEGECKLEVGDGLASHWIAPFLPAFLASHPNISLKLFTTLDSNVRRDLEFDIQIQYFGRNEGDDVARRLGTLHFMPFASRDYVKLNGLPKTKAELAGHRIIEYTQAVTHRGAWQSWIPDDAERESILFTNSNSLLGAGVLAGIGIALLPTYSAAVDPNIVPILTGAYPKAPIWAGYNRITGQKPAVRAVLNWLKEVVFHPAYMPWFKEDFVAPEHSWLALRANLLETPAPEPPHKND